MRPNAKQLMLLECVGQFKYMLFDEALCITLPNLSCILTELL